MKTEALDPSPDGCHDAALPNCSPDNPPTPSSSVLQLIAATIIIFHKVIIVALAFYDVLTFAAACDRFEIDRASVLVRSEAGYGEGQTNRKKK